MELKERRKDTVTRQEVLDLIEPLSKASHAPESCGIVKADHDTIMKLKGAYAIAIVVLTIVIPLLTVILSKWLK